MQVDDDPGELKFQYEFKEKAYLLGNARATFHVSCNDHDDFDVWVQLRKVDKNGKLLQQVNIPSKDSGLADEEVERSNPLVYLGPTGVLRASHRKIDAAASTPTFPEHDYAHENKVPPGTVVELQIGLWQTGIAFQEGERLMLKVSGHNMVLAEFPPIRGKESLENIGMHNLHIGALRPSSISIPLVSL
jgi:predicted acyl esterase